MLRKLGRGLDSLIEETRETPREVPRNLPLASIRPNAHQPRRDFDEDAIGELADSIREHGLLQPVLVRQRGDDGYELVAGERRYRACRSLGLEEIPAIVREVPDERMLEIALVENLQREDLNPIEKAEAYRRYVTELGLTHEAAAARLGKDRSTITNQLRLLELPPDLQDMVSRGTLRMGHARALLGVAEEAVQRRIARRVEREGISVREVERLARKEREAPKSRPASPLKPVKSAYLADLERRLRERFTTKVRIEGDRTRGRVSIEYYSLEELSRLLELLLPE